MKHKNLKKILTFFVLGSSFFVLSACSTTTITETTYKDDGVTVASVKTTEASGNPFVIFAQNSANKNWVFHQGGWGFNIGYENWGINGGSLDNTIASFTATQESVEIAKLAPAIVDASKYTISITQGGLKTEKASEAKE